MKNEGQMKSYKWKSMLIGVCLAAALIVSGCGGGGNAGNGNANAGAGSNPPVSEEPPAATPEGKVDQELLDRLQAALKDAADASVVTAFITEHISVANQATADAMLRALHAYYDANLEAAQQAFFEDGVQEALLAEQWPITEEAAASIKDEAAKKLALGAFKGGYKLETVEGSIYPIVDYGYQKRFGEQLSEPMNAYIGLKAAESDKATVKDGGLVIAWDELAARALEAEQYLDKYKDSPEREEVLSLYVDRYLAMYVNGQINSPIYDRETMKLLDEVKASYMKTVADAADSVTGQLVAKFLTALAETDERVAELKDGEAVDLPAVKPFRDGLADEARKLLAQP
ncbi:hypothetical protein [Paenibacillus arenilitoris]|uniref:Lipoprotein n=1 Tax=Paenibacillus arenilitoris TaxID=2772299 RepID=A0A927CJ72_9BACL|nr:hypothetical protein [Paenibacillus arenilitoris]MBD2867608.1 hypothetical protein [Paenibacillus arenilitoris]